MNTREKIKKEAEEYAKERGVKRTPHAFFHGDLSILSIPTVGTNSTTPTDKSEDTYDWSTGKHLGEDE